MESTITLLVAHPHLCFEFIESFLINDEPRVLNSFVDWLTSQKSDNRLDALFRFEIKILNSRGVQVSILQHLVGSRIAIEST